MTTKSTINSHFNKASAVFASKFEEFFQKHLEKLIEIKAKLKQPRELDYYNWMDFDYLEKVNQETKALAQKIKSQNYKNALVIGMGGSGINALVLKNALYEFAPQALKKSQINLIVQNNLDPVSMKARLESIKSELDKTLIVLISKSGNTDEVKRNLISTLNFYHDESQIDLNKLAKQILIITEPKQEAKKNLLHDLKAELESKSGEEIAFLENDPKIGGRFSMFSPVGMLPAELMGLDSSALIAGAKRKYQEFLEDENSPIGKLAAFDIFLSQKESYSSRYSMVYSDSLEAFNKFRAQLKGESLCKNGIDSTVHVPGVGTVNHHSDLELLLKKNNGVVMEQIFFAKPFTEHENKTSLDCLADLNGQENYQSLLDNHINPLASYMLENKFPVIQTIIAEQNESSMGEMMMQDMLITVVQAGLQDELGKFEKLDLVIRQHEVENYKKNARK